MSLSRGGRAVSILVTALAGGSAVAGGGTLISADGMWRATLDNHGQVIGFFTPGQPNTDRISEARIYEANPDSQNLSRRVQDTYAVALGPVIDQGGTHAFTRLIKSVGEGDPPSGDCCVESKGRGCEDPVCEAAICDIDDFCCVFWDQTCADLANREPACQCAAAPPPIRLELEHFMVDGAAGGVLVVMRAINDDPTDPIPVKLFSYVDLDIGSPDNDEAAVVPNPGGGELAIRQFIAANGANPMWFGGCPPYKSFEVDEWPAVTNRLDAGVTQLLGADLTAPGPADHSLALASGTETLQPGEALQMQVAFGAVGFSGCLGPACPWDIDGDGSVAITDLLALLAAWGPNPGHPADFDGSGQVEITDLLALLAHWGPC